MIQHKDVRRNTQKLCYQPDNVLAVACSPCLDCWSSLVAWCLDWADRGRLRPPVGPGRVDGGHYGLPSLALPHDGIDTNRIRIDARNRRYRYNDYGINLCGTPYGCRPNRPAFWLRSRSRDQFGGRLFFAEAYGEPLLAPRDQEAPKSPMRKNVFTLRLVPRTLANRPET